mgnify:CR=1 FL=1
MMVAALPVLALPVLAIPVLAIPVLALMVLPHRKHPSNQVCTLDRKPLHPH